VTAPQGTSLVVPDPNAEGGPLPRYRAQLSCDAQSAGDGGGGGIEVWLVSAPPGAADPAGAAALAAAATGEQQMMEVQQQQEEQQVRGREIEGERDRGRER